jgi:hypothetical protein
MTYKNPFKSNYRHYQESSERGYDRQFTRRGVVLRFTDTYPENR